MLKCLLSMLCFACFLLQMTCSFADVSRAGVLFLLIDPDARAGGIGGASVALADDALATHYNPAGITGVQLVSGELSYYQWLPELASDLYYAHGCGVMNLKDYGHLGIALTHFSSGEHIRTDVHGNVLGTFKSYEMAIAASYGYQFANDFSAGMSFKYIHSKLSEQGAGMEKGKGTGKSVAVDLGMLYRNILPDLTLSVKSAYPELAELLRNRKGRGLSVGLVVANLGPDISYIDVNQGDALPRELRLGVAYRAMDTDFLGVNVAIDYCKELVGLDESFAKEFLDPGGGVVLEGGIEAAFLYLLTLRYGYHYDEEGDVEHHTLGLGIGPEWARLNVSHIPEEGDLAVGGTTRFSLMFDYPIAVF